MVHQEDLDPSPQFLIPVHNKPRVLGQRNKPFSNVESRSSGIIENSSPSHMINVLNVRSKIVSLNGQQIVYTDFVTTGGLGQQIFRELPSLLVLNRFFF